MLKKGVLDIGMHGWAVTSEYDLSHYGTRTQCCFVCALDWSDILASYPAIGDKITNLWRKRERPQITSAGRIVRNPVGASLRVDERIRP